MSRQPAMRVANFSLALLFMAFGLAAQATEIPLSDRKSGYEFMGPQSRAMQDDDTANPGMLSVFDGEALWNAKAGTANQSCAGCHGDPTQSMRGVAARYPAFNAARGRPLDLEGQINLCRAERQQASPFAYESRELLALTAFVARQSRGMPIAVTDDDKTKPFIEAGRAIFDLRQGQLNLSCAQCHDDNWGQKLAGTIVPQGHATGYPQYRLEWQSMGSLRRRLRNCLVGMRAEPYAANADEYTDLTLFLMQRARGMKFEAPAVRP
jgi:sulfur-oxidizing protein SoxA